MTKEKVSYKELFTRDIFEEIWISLSKKEKKFILLNTVDKGSANPKNKERLFKYLKSKKSTFEDYYWIWMSYWIEDLFLDDEENKSLKKGKKDLIIKVLDFFKITHREGFIDETQDIEREINASGLRKLIKKGLSEEEKKYLYFYIVYKLMIVFKRGEIKEVLNDIDWKIKDDNMNNSDKNTLPENISFNEKKIEMMKKENENLMEKNKNLIKENKSKDDKIKELKSKANDNETRYNDLRRKHSELEKGVKWLSNWRKNGTIFADKVPGGEFINEVYHDIQSLKNIRWISSLKNKYESSDDLNSFASELIEYSDKILPDKSSSGIIIFCRDTKEMCLGAINDSIKRKLLETDILRIMGEMPKGEDIFSWGNSYYEKIKKTGRLLSKKLPDNIHAVPILLFTEYKSIKKTVYNLGYFVIKTQENVKLSSSEEGFSYDIVSQIYHEVDVLDRNRLLHIKNHLDELETLFSTLNKITTKEIKTALNGTVKEIIDVMPGNSQETERAVNIAFSGLLEIIRKEKNGFAFGYADRSLVNNKNIDFSQRKKGYLLLLKEGVFAGKNDFKKCETFIKNTLKELYLLTEDIENFNTFQSDLLNIFYDQDPKPKKGKHKIKTFKINEKYLDIKGKAEKYFEKKQYFDALKAVKQIFTYQESKGIDIPESDIEKLILIKEESEVHVNDSDEVKILMVSEEFLEDISTEYTSNASVRNLINILINSGTYRWEMRRPVPSSNITRYGFGRKYPRLIADYLRERDQLQIYRLFPSHNNEYEDLLQNKSYTKPGLIPVIPSDFIKMLNENSLRNYFDI